MGDSVVEIRSRLGRDNQIWRVIMKRAGTLKLVVPVAQQDGSQVHEFKASDFPHKALQLFQRLVSI